MRHYDAVPMEGHTPEELQVEYDRLFGYAGIATGSTGTLEIARWINQQRAVHTHGQVERDGELFHICINCLDPWPCMPMQVYAQFATLLRLSIGHMLGLDR